MGNKSTRKVPVNKERFMEVLRLRNSSIRKLGNAYEKIERTEKTIRRYLDNGEMPPDLLDKIAKYLDVHPDYLSGVYDDEADRIEDAFLRAMSKSFIKPEKYPYLLKAKGDIGYTTYFENILTMNDISMDLFHTLPPEERVLFRQEMVVAIMQVIAKHFTHDSLGNDVAETLAYCESYVGDFDPFSCYAELEGIGLPEPDLDEDFCDEESMCDFEKRMEAKYGKPDKGQLNKNSC
ncbi:MAG: helix-turn-helix domain-containing protein [Acutalibacteraceae bacterium]